MIVRIVRMEFKPKLTEQFLNVFNASKSQIRAFPGCNHLELHRDAEHENVFFTYSHWNGLEDLENYRLSPLFQETWAKTKILFQAKPLAYSLHLEQVVHI